MIRVKTLSALFFVGRAGRALLSWPTKNILNMHFLVEKEAHFFLLKNLYSACNNKYVLHSYVNWSWCNGVRAYLQNSIVYNKSRDNISNNRFIYKLVLLF